MNNIINDITNYIEFLRESGFLVMLSCFNPVLEKHLPTLLNYEPHLPEICSFLKSDSTTRHRCIINKQILKNHSPKEEYYSCCWAGVEEFVIPIVYQHTLICCVNLSGYKGRLDKSKVLFEKLKNRLKKDFYIKYNKLSDDIPTLDTVHAITNPLKYMFFSLYDECLRTHDENDTSTKIYIEAIEYINKHYMEKLTIDCIAEALNYSPSYLRVVFKNKSGKTIIEYLNSARLAYSANLLKLTNNSITDIALDCGFCDGNYFSTLFKKEFGISPIKYRKQQKVTVTY